MESTVTQSWKWPIPFFGDLAGTTQGVAHENLPATTSLATNGNANTYMPTPGIQMQLPQLAAQLGFKKCLTLPYQAAVAPIHWSACPDTPSNSNVDSQSMVGIGNAVRLDMSNIDRSMLIRLTALPRTNHAQVHAPGAVNRISMVSTI